MEAAAVDTASIDRALAMLRANKDCTLRPCRYVSSAFLSIAPHRVGIAHLMFKPRFLLTDCTGGGKTPQALVAYAHLRDRDAHLRLLVVTNKSAVYQWAGAVNKFLVGLPCEVIASDTAATARVSAWREATAPILITNWHTMVRDRDAITSALDYYVVVFDEIQAAKNWKQKHFWPTASLLARKARYAWGLTATPMMNRLSELYSIVEIIRPGTFGKWSRFGATYLIRDLVKLRNNRRVWKVKGAQHLDQLQRIIEPFVLGRRAEEIDAHLPQLPPPVVRLTEMGREQRIAYTSIVNKWLPVADLATEGRQLAMLSSLTYAQIASDAPAALDINAPSAKIDELVRILEDEYPEDKVVVFSRFTKVLAQVHAALHTAKIPHTQITGAESSQAREVRRIAFTNDPALRVMCISTAGGTALDLQAARVVIFFDLPWSYGEFKQVVGRVRRIGSVHKRMLLILLINKDSIDEDVLNLLYEKVGLITAVFGTAPRDPVASNECGVGPDHPDATTTLFEAVRLRGAA